MIKILTLIVSVLFFSADIYAANDLVQNWQFGFQDPASPLSRAIHETHNYIMIFVVLITLFVLLLLAYCCFKFRENKNPTPSTTSHNTLLEIIWIAIPVIIVTLITIPSLKLIFFQEKIPESEMTLKVIGRQWYWSYEYPDNGDIYFDSYMVKDEDLKEGEPRLLTTDNKVYLPTETYIKIQMTSSDVIHAFALPALGVKMDAVPGRLNETWVYIEKAGTYYGQCSELCGVLHAFMPIEVVALPPEEFKKWVEEAKKEFAFNGNLKISSKL
ncbi:MAG: cytochrome c oxidase subunit II [Rickettsiales bacterium]|nr:cytochrome c oxidase subunit II [Rickettsiales bacterium]